MTGDPGIKMRVWVEDAWDLAVFDATPDWTVVQLKEHALRTATMAQPDLAGYEVKLRGALILDESETLGGLGVADLAPFTVMSKHRRAVR